MISHPACSKRQCHKENARSILQKEPSIISRYVANKMGLAPFLKGIVGTVLIRGSSGQEHTTLK